MEIGYVGLGAMGGALARRLILSHKLHVLDLRPDVVQSFTDNGAIPAQNGAALAQTCDIILTCLPRSSNVRDAIFGPGSLAEGWSPARSSSTRPPAIRMRRAPWPPNWPSAASP